MNRDCIGRKLLPALAFVAIGTFVWAGDPSPEKKPPKKKAGPSFTLSKETTYITAPLRKGGFPDYIAAINQLQSKGVTPENNAAVLFWKAAGPKAISEKTRKRHFELLGIPPLLEKGDYFVTSSDFVERQKADNKLSPDELKKLEEGSFRDQFNTVTQRPWSKKEFPLVAEWLAVNEKPLVVMAEAGRRPRYYDPLLASAGDNGLLIAALLPGAMDSRNFVRALWARAMLRIQEGKIDETWADLLTCHRLGRHIGQGPTLDEWLVGITIDYVAQTGDQAILQHGKLTAAQLAKMRTELAQLPPMLKTADKVDMGERMMFLDAALAMAEGNTDSLVGFFAAYGPNESLAAKVKTAALASLDWDIVLRMSNTWYDRLTVAARKPTRAERVKAFAGFDAELKKLAESSRNPQTLGWALLGGQKAVSTQMGQMLVSLLLPVVSAVSGAEDRAAMQRAETDLAFALAQYRADHGAYPAKLADLAPKYVAKVPRDIFNNDADLKYHAENGSYLLYSFGLNGKDDGGKTNGEFSKSGPGDDVTVRMPAATK